MGQRLLAGEVFAGYRIERLLGVGGMGEVYLARDRSLPRPVALKLLGVTVARDPGVRARFQREADLAARLSHPNIVTIHDRGETEERLWIAMEFIDGSDAGRLVRSGPVAPDVAVDIIGTVAQALDFAHEAGVLHRDVKPANILLTNARPSRVLLTDFGIAKALDETMGATQTGEVYASLQYAAPEQLDPDIRVDQRVDVYSLGCTLFHLLTGQLPYRATNTAQLIHAHLHRPIPAPSTVNPTVPKGFDKVIATALAKDPADRYSTCGELADAAARVLAPATPAPIVHPPRRWPRIIALAATVLAAAATTGVYLYNSSSPDNFTEAARDAACAYARTISTFDIKTPADAAAFDRQVDAGATSRWISYIQGARTTLDNSMIAVQARSEVHDLQCTVNNSTADHAQITAFVTATVSNANDHTGKTKVTGLVMTMKKVDGRWLCDDMSNTEINALTTAPTPPPTK
ncbi:serine/threonine-protein kinase [Nocardia terrae]|uniref:serine/threonine-protein kinase n=1 Tax=Nocardia terrae TaxID=2675851 RepID=UPI002E276D94